PGVRPPTPTIAATHHRPTAACPRVTTPIASWPTTNTPRASCPTATTPVASCPTATTPVARCPKARTPTASSPTATHLITAGRYRIRWHTAGMGDPVCWLDRTCPSCGALWEGAEE